MTFVTNGNVQEVKLLARGQNAVFHGGPNQYTTLACDEVWTAELPHVIYGRILVDPGCTLTILPGAEVYAHDESGIWVRGGTLVADGSMGAPIQFRGDRLEDNYADTPGQWGLAFEITDTLSGSLVNFSAFRGGIWLDRAVNCVLDHVDLRQATVGVWVDSVGTDADYALRLTNSVLSNMESIGLLSQSGHIEDTTTSFPTAVKHAATSPWAATSKCICRRLPTSAPREWAPSIPHRLRQRLVRSGQRERSSEALCRRRRIQELHRRGQQRLSQ